MSERCNNNNKNHKGVEGALVKTILTLKRNQSDIMYFRI